MIPLVLEESGGSERVFDIYSRLLRERIIFLGEQVTSETANRIVAQLLFLEAEDPEKDIYMYINSPGGSVYDGLGIFDTMQHVKPDIHTVCVGLAASMGAFLLAAGTHGKRSSLRHSRIMIHQPLGGARGQASDIRIQADEILFLKERLNTELSERTGKDYDTIKEDTDRDFYMSPNEAVTNLEKENSLLTNSIEKMKLEHSINEKLIEEKFKSKISERDLTIQELREMKSRLSTKMIGETLEIHCETQFNLNRASAFKNSYFEKDNDATSGSKGDYIFKEFDENKTEVVSIMFEMKNESLNGTNKRKNEDFLKELDKDRRQKSCEYAVLVSLLEPDSELYNAGIVDVSHRFPKMYVIRPQFFLPIISLLRNASLETLKYKSQIDLMKRENFDITNFESTLEQFKNAVGKMFHLPRIDLMMQFQKLINQ